MICLTPLMETALRAMTRGELRYTVDIGWTITFPPSNEGEKIIAWNSHTIRWLAGHGFCAVRGSRAAITLEGRDALDAADRWAA